eukprot:gene764-947_t
MEGREVNLQVVKECLLGRVIKCDLIGFERIPNLVIINLLIFLMQKLLGVNLVSLLGLRYVFSPQFKYFQLVTHLFTHASFYHLFMTGLGAVVLYMLASYLEISRLENVYYQYFDYPTPKSFMNLLHKFPHIYTTYQPFIDDFFSHAEDPAYIAKSQSIAAQLAPLIERKIDRPVVGASGATFGTLSFFMDSMSFTQGYKVIRPIMWLILPIWEVFYLLTCLLSGIGGGCVEVQVTSSGEMNGVGDKDQCPCWPLLGQRPFYR